MIETIAILLQAARFKRPDIALITGWDRVYLRKQFSRAWKKSDMLRLRRELEKVRKAKRTISEEEMIDRLFLPMMMEATRCLEDGIARDPADVDMGLILGIGFPTFRGGLLRWADTLGLPRVLEMLKKYEHLGTRYQPTEQMRQLAASKRGFYG